MEEKWTSHIGFIAGALSTMVPSLKFWIGQATFTVNIFEAGFKVFLFVATAFLSGAIGKFGQDMYANKIKPWMNKKKRRR